MATFNDVPRLKYRPHTPHDAVLYATAVAAPRIRDPPGGDYPFENLAVQCGTTPSNSNTSIQRPLARHRVMLSRRVIAYYGLIRASESLPATYGFVVGAAAPKEIGLRWESRGSPIYSAGLCSRAASLTPVTRRVQMTVASSSVLAFACALQVRRSHWTFRGCRVHSELISRSCYGPRVG
jgi:hypothetical protein